jgi:hypothetical protein
MANRNFASGGKIYSMHVQVVEVDAVINIGASGAVSSSYCTMASSIVRVSQGIYKINLSNNFNSLLSVQASMSSAPSALSGIMAVEVANAQSAAVQDLSAPSLTIKTLDVAGALADPASGSAINISAIMSNSSVRLPGEQP